MFAITQCNVRIDIDIGIDIGIGRFLTRSDAIPVDC